MQVAVDSMPAEIGVVDARFLPRPACEVAAVAREAVLRGVVKHDLQAVAEDPELGGGAGGGVQQGVGGPGKSGVVALLEDDERLAHVGVGEIDAVGALGGDGGVVAVNAFPEVVIDDGVGLDPGVIHPVQGVDAAEILAVQHRAGVGQVDIVGGIDDRGDAFPGEIFVREIHADAIDHHVAAQAVKADPHPAAVQIGGDGVEIHHLPVEAAEAEGVHGAVLALDEVAVLPVAVAQRERRALGAAQPGIGHDTKVPDGPDAAGAAHGLVELEAVLAGGAADGEGVRGHPPVEKDDLGALVFVDEDVEAVLDALGGVVDGVGAVVAVGPGAAGNVFDGPDAAGTAFGVADLGLEGVVFLIDDVGGVAGIDSDGGAVAVGMGGIDVFACPGGAAGAFVGIDQPVLAGVPIGGMDAARGVDHHVGVLPGKGDVISDVVVVPI